MSNIDNIIIEHLRIIRAEVASVSQKIDNLTLRIGSVEQGVAILHQDNANIRSIVAEQGIRLDRLSDRVERIEHRLELVG